MRNLLNNFETFCISHFGYATFTTVVEATQQMGQPILPLKKLSLLVWKLTLAIFGGFQEAHDLKNTKRIDEGLDPIENPMDIVRQLTPVTTQVDVMIMGENVQENQVMAEMGDRRAEINRGQNPRPKLVRDSQKDEEDDDDDVNDVIEDDEGQSCTIAYPSVSHNKKNQILVKNQNSGQIF